MLHFHLHITPYHSATNHLGSICQIIETNGLINSSDVFASDRIGTIDQITKAIQNNKRVIVGVNVENGLHAVMIKKVKVWPSGRYMIYFAETSPVRQVPCCVSNFSAKYVWIFYLH